jgi:tetratricopeptide (TPR) repeat protein
VATPLVAQNCVMFRHALGMPEFLRDHRRQFALAVIVAFCGASSGVIGLLVGEMLLGLEDEKLILFVTLVSGAGGVLGQSFTPPLLSAALEGVITPKPPPAPDPAELEHLYSELRFEIQGRRVREANSQREQMLSTNTVMEIAVSQNLELRAGAGGKPVVKVSGQVEQLEDLTRSWQRSEGRLVILGKPGYGKTFAALTLIGKINEGKDRIAELFPLIDWYIWSIGRRGATIEDWLVHEISHTYPELSAAARPLVMERRLVPIFDGLDEIPARARVDCRNALEAYAGRESPHRPFVLTCREDEYLELSPKWVGADRQVALTGLDGEEIASVLRADAAPSSSWSQVLRGVEKGDPHLLALLRSPLRLATALEVYESRDPRELLELAKRGDAGEELWDLLLGTEAHSYEEHTRTEVRSWLSFAAASMKSHNRQRFWLHELYLYASPDDRHWFFRLGLALLLAPVLIQAALSEDVFGWLLAGVLGIALYLLYRSRRDDPLQIPVRHRASPLNYVKALPGSIFFGLMLGLLWATAVLPVVWILYLVTRGIHGIPLELGEAGVNAAKTTLISAISMVAIGISMRLGEEGTHWVAEEPPEHLLGRGPAAVIKSARNHGLFATLIAGSILTIVHLLIVPGPQSFPVVVVSAIFFAWASGLEAWAYYQWTRWRLSRRGLLPLQLRKFLDWAAQDTGLLRARDAYEFRHRELLDYLARGVAPVGRMNVSWEEWRRRRSGASQQASAARTETSPAALRTSQQLATQRRLEKAAKAIQDEPADAAARSNLSRALIRAGNPLGALPHAREANCLDPENVRYAADHARVLDLLCQGPEAIEVLDEAIAPFPSPPSQLQTLRANVLENLHRRQTRIETATKEITAGPEHALAWWDLSVAHLSAGEAEEAAAARQRAVELADRSSPESIALLGWRLNACGYSHDAHAVGQSLSSEDGIRRAAVLGHALSDLRRFDLADPYLKRTEAAATQPAVLDSLARLLMVRGRWADARQAVEQARLKDPEEAAYAFTRAETFLVAGDLDASREALASALAEARRSGSPPGEPAWLCRILWQHNAFSGRELAVDAVIEEYRAHGFESALAEGLLAGTPTGPEQNGWNPARLPEWCAQWGRHREVRHAVGVVQALVVQTAERSAGALA